MTPRRGQLAAAVIAALFLAIALEPGTRNTYLELVGETLFVGMVVLLAFNAAGAWRQRWLRPWVAQLLVVGLGGMLAPPIVQLITVGGDITIFVNSRSLRTFFTAIDDLGRPRQSCPAVTLGMFASRARFDQNRSAHHLTKKEIS